MKRWLKVLLWIVLSIFVVVGGVAVWQRNNIAMFVYYKTHDRAQLAQNLTEKRAQLQEQLQQQAPDVNRDFTPEEEAEILRGIVTPEQAVAKLLGAQYGGSGNDGGAVQGEQEAESTIAKYVGQLYGLKAYYLGRLGAIEGQVAADYASLTAKEGKVLDKESFIAKYVGYAAALESECDAKVSTLLNSLKAELQRTGSSTAAIKTIRDAYYAEKSVKKAYYLNLISGSN